MFLVCKFRPFYPYQAAPALLVTFLFIHSQRMFARAAFFVSFTLLLVGQAYTAPFIGKSSDVIARSAEPVESVNIIERQIPVEIAVKAADGVVTPYSKREEEELVKREREERLEKRQIPVEIPVKAPQGIVVPY